MAAWCLAGDLLQQTFCKLLLACSGDTWNATSCCFLLSRVPVLQDCMMSMQPIWRKEWQLCRAQSAAPPHLPGSRKW